MSLKLGECYLLFYTQDEKIVSSEMEARYFISNWKIIRVNSIAGKTFLSIVEQSRRFIYFVMKLYVRGMKKGR